jgi:hypothetical protein
MSWLNANEYFLMRAAVEERVEDLQATSDVVLSSPESPESEPCEGADPEKSRAVCGVVSCGARQGPRALEGLGATR